MGGEKRGREKAGVQRLADIGLVIAENFGLYSRILEAIEG